MSIQRLFIANRGEIAVRIVRAAQSLGIHTIQAHSEADAEMMAVRMADEAVCIGPAQASKSYLNVDAVVKAAKDAGADAVHPGYGFLAESPRFARAVAEAGMIFVGPSADTIQSMGDKVSARQAAETAGVPVVPGSDGRVDDMDAAAEIAERIGYPVMIKASAGGGGRGIRIAETPEELAKLAPQARQEAQAAFGDGGIYIEKVIREPRHIEVQVLADGKRAVHCFERECSLQRRRQKVWEEAPAFALPEATRAAMCDSAVDLAEAVQYMGAGTVEYLYDALADKYYFIEMNTRIQVEHPVTEMVTGLDLVALMIRVCGGEALPVSQDEIALNGHAIEVRLNAEDPLKKFMPFPGVVGALDLPESDGIRVDHFLYEGYQIPPFYDSLIGKLIVHADTREAAIDKMAGALDAVKIDGLKTTIPLHKALATSPDVRAGRIHTQWLEPWLEAGNLTPETGGAS
ncbi:acetyl-CoA carboxylase, biotin carboxylase subunit [Roseovarius nanhaiticus]|uniref:biotin carboxylase n=1 Tax=Roseovarius nanhaiticus TaxID=573024 RepID=A0A1N7H070_9RHOB|nr:acetyl-CoA carboxylase biotin carboxylase subunit [Roseovarius nanhaiticus]SEL17614.1 acetyl-CoA carboxylase, biotin carboxylase subunit [Roseovarius nanhaiticus]SIS18257.1 acetyl-CoA carboxylase, biotin carboxylase subunit [Roseovarius nanhaiticus]